MCINPTRDTLLVSHGKKSWQSLYVQVQLFPGKIKFFWQIQVFWGWVKVSPAQNVVNSALTYIRPQSDDKQGINKLQPKNISQIASKFFTITQHFFTDHLNHKTVNKTTCWTPSGNPCQLTTTLVEKLSSCCDYFLMLSGFPD